MKKYDLVGYAEVYLDSCNKESDSNDIIDINVYKKLVELDTKLGTSASDQLFKCLKKTTRLDIIEVRFYDLNLSLKMILDYRF